MGKYFIYHMKKTAVRFAVMALFLLVIVNTTVVRHYTSSFSGEEVYNVSLAAFATFSIIAPAAVAALEFSQFMNRRNLDTWYSLPVSRRDLFIVHFGNGAVQLVLSVLVSAFLAAFKISRYPALDLADTAVYFAYAIGAMLLIYMLYTFFFVSANNVFDGCVFMFGAYIIPRCVFNIFRNFYYAVNSSRGFLGIYDTELPFDGDGIFSTITKLSSRYESLIEPVRTRRGIDMSEIKIPEVSIPQAFVWTMICIVALAGAVYVFTTKKTEVVSGVSESWFGYRILIPLCTASALNSSALAAGAMMEDPVMGIGLSLVGLIPSFIGVFVAYVIFRRGVKFKISDFISVGAVVVFYVASLLIFRVLLG